MSVLAAVARANEAEAEKASADPFARVHDGSFYEYEGSLTTSEFDDLLVWAGDRKASDITIQTDRQVMAEIGGQTVPISRRPVTQSEIELIVAYVYGPHGPGSVKAGYDLDPSHEVRMGRLIGLRRYRVNVTGGRVPGGDGMQITIRTLPASPIPLAQLNVEPDIVANIRPRQGMVIISGPTGSGKSTLASSMLREILERPNANEKILEYSSPLEYVYDDVPQPNATVWQTEVGRHLRPHEDAGRTKNEETLFSYATRNALRRKPTIIVVGETRDAATMQASVDAALGGHLLYTTMHVIGVAESLRRMIQFFPQDARSSVSVDIMESLRMVVTQLLFPRKGGGRVALREFMVFDAQTRNQFLRRPTDEWPLFARKLLEGKRVAGQLMTEAAWNAYERGDIDAETYKSIVAAERDRA